MSAKLNNKNALDHTVPSPKKNQSQNYYSQLLGRTNSHLHSTFMSPQMNSINTNHQSQTGMTNSVQVSSILHSSQNLNTINSAFQNSATIGTAINSIQNIPVNLESIQKNSNQVSNSNVQQHANNSNNNYKLTDILSTRYSSGTLKLIRNGQTSVSSNPRQLSSDARQFEGGGSQHSNSNQDFNHSPANINSIKQNTQNNQQIGQSSFNNTNLANSNFISIGGANSQKQQLMNKVKIQLSSQQQQKNQQFTTQPHSQNVHNIHSGYGSHSSASQGIQSSAISPRTFSNLVQDKLMRSKLQSTQQLQTIVSATSQSSVKESNKNVLNQQSKRPKSLKQIESEYNSNPQNHQIIHEQNMNILAGMTLNNRNGSEKNLLRSQQMAGQIVSQNLPAQQQTNQQQNQYQQHVQQIQASKMMLLQQQNNMHNNEQLNTLMQATTKPISSVTPSSQTQMNYKYETNLIKHQTSHSVEKFRGQSESLDTHNRQSDIISPQGQKIVINKQQQKKGSTTIPETSKNRNKKNNDYNNQGNNNYRNSFTKKQQQNQTIQSNLSNSTQGIALHQNSQNNHNANTNQQNNSNNNYLIQNNNQANQGLSNSYVNSLFLSNSSKQTLTAITQRIQQNLNTLTDPAQQNKISSQNQTDQQFVQQNKQCNIQNIDEIINKVEINQQDISKYEKRETSEKNMSPNQPNVSPINSSKTHKQTNSLTESNKNSQQNTLQKEEINSYQQALQQQAINFLVNSTSLNYRSGQQQNNTDQTNSLSNTPQGKIINQGHHKQQIQIQSKDGAKHNIYFMKEKERVSKKNDFGQQKNKRKGEQSTPHSNTQGYPQILMSNSALNQSSQGQLALSALQKSSGSITNSVNQNLLSSNIIKYINKQSNKTEDEKLFEQAGLNQLQTSQYLANAQMQSKDNISKQREIHTYQQNQHQESEAHHEKKNSIADGSQSYKKVFATTEGSYLWDLKHQNEDLIPYISPKNISNYSSLTTQTKHQEKTMSTIQEMNSYQSIQNKNNSQNISNSKQQSQKHVVLSSNTFASPLASNLQNQIQHIGNSINQSKSINEETPNNNITTSEKGKYLQYINNLFVKDNKRHLIEKNQAQDNGIISNSISHQKSNTEQFNNLSQVNEPNQKQQIKEYPQSDQKLEDIPSNALSYNIKNQLKMQISEIPQIKLYAASAETSPPLAGQNYYVEQIIQPMSQINNQLVNINPFNQLKSQVLRQGEQVLEKLKEVVQKDEKDNKSHQNGEDLHSLNSSLVQIKSRQSVYSQNEVQLQESSSQNNLIINEGDQGYNISFSQNKFQYNPNLEFQIVQKKTETILNKYKQNSIKQAQQIQECNIRISELNQNLKEKDNQLLSLQHLLKESENLIESQKQEVQEKNEFIDLLKNQIQEILKNPQMYSNIPQKDPQTVQKLQKSNINVVDNYISSPTAVNHSKHSINSTSPKRLTKTNSQFQQTTVQPFNNMYFAQEGYANSQQNQQTVRLSLPAFPQKHFGFSSDIPKSNNQNCLFQSQKELEESADFTGNKDNSLESLKKKYQVLSLNKKSYSLNPFYTDLYGSKSLQSSQKMSSNKDQFKGNNQNSNSTEQENDPLNDSTKLLKQISKKGPSQHPQNFSENSWPKQIQRHSLDFAKHNYDQNLNPMNCEQNKLSENQFNFGIQGSFSNLQTVENQDEQIKIEFQNQQSHKQSEAFTQATPTNSQNQTLIHQKDIQPSQRYENRLFSTEQDDYQPNNNQLNPNDSFNTGFAHFGGSNQAEENYQNIDNSFRECHFGQSSKNDQIYSEPEFGNNALNLNKQNERTKSQNQEIISLSSKSSYCFKIASDSNSPNVNNSFSKKQAQEINHDYTLQKGCSNRNLVNNSFNNNFNNEDEQQEEVVDVEAANNQFNTSFSQIPLADQNQILGQSENRQSFTCENQVNISFEGGFGCQNQEKAANEQETIQYQQGEREKNYQQQEEQQQGISFVNQSFG